MIVEQEIQLESLALLRKKGVLDFTRGIKCLASKQQLKASSF